MRAFVIRLLTAAFLLFMGHQIYSGVNPGARSYIDTAAAQSAQARGTISALLHNNGNRAGDTVSQTVRVEFVTVGGEKLSFEAVRTGHNAKVGMTVPVRYDPANPHSCGIVPATDPTPVFYVFYLVAAAFAIGGLVNLVGAVSLSRAWRASGK